MNFLSKPNMPIWVQRTLSISLALFLAIAPAHAFAAVYHGDGLWAGILAASGLGGITSIDNIFELIITIINFVLDIILFVAVIAIIVAGIYLITSNGDEGQKDKAKKIILYVVIGIIVILFARAIVLLINSIFG